MSARIYVLFAILLVQVDVKEPNVEARAATVQHVVPN
jgi:hypothetical protein